MERRLRLLEEAESYARELERELEPLEKLDPRRPYTFVSIGGGELGDLVLTAAKRVLGGPAGGVVTVALDRYEGFPAQDSADRYEVVDLLDGAALREAVRRHVPRPREQPHAVYVEIESANVDAVFRMGVEEGYNVVSTPYAPLVGTDRLATKLMFEKLGLPAVRWEYAASEEEVRRAAKRLGLPVIIKPVTTSSGHGTTIARTWRDVERAYEHSLRHARGRGDEVVVEEYLEELKEEGVEVTQLVVRHFDERGSLTETALPPVEHQRPAATYHESWLPPTVPEGVRRSCREHALRVARFLGGLGLYAVEQFVVRGRVYNSEFANRPHDTAMLTRWAARLDEGALHLLASMGVPLAGSDAELSVRGLYCAAHVILAPEGVRPGAPVTSWSPSSVRSFMARRGIRGDVWYFGKPTAYPGRRMGLAVAFHEDLAEARRAAEELAHFAERCISYG